MDNGSVIPDVLRVVWILVVGYSKRFKAKGRPGSGKMNPETMLLTLKTILISPYSYSLPSDEGFPIIEMSPTRSKIDPNTGIN